MAMTMEPRITSEMRECIDRCTECHHICQETVMHCLSMGGKHSEPNHIRLLMDCVEICRTSADFMLRGSDLHGEVCRVCAEVCERCADSCDQFQDDAHMRVCSDACRRCAESCHRIANQSVQMIAI